MRYFLSQPGEHPERPYSVEELRAMETEGQIGAETMLTEAGSRRQLTLADIRELSKESLPIGGPSSSRHEPGPIAELPSTRKAPPWKLFLGAGALFVLVGALLTVVLPVFASARKAATTSVALSNAKELGTALGVYVADWDDRMPPDMSSAEAAKPSLLRYVRQPLNPDKDIFGSMSTTDSFLAGNPRLSGAKFDEFESPSDVMVFFDSQDWNDGRRIVLFLDLSVSMAPGDDVATASQNGFILLR